MDYPAYHNNSRHTAEITDGINICIGRAAHGKSNAYILQRSIADYTEHEKTAQG